MVVAAVLKRFFLNFFVFVQCAFAIGSGAGSILKNASLGWRVSTYFAQTLKTHTFTIWSTITRATPAPAPPTGSRNTLTNRSGKSGLQENRCNQ